MKRTGIVKTINLSGDYQLTMMCIVAGLIVGSIYAIAVKDEQGLWLVVNQYMVQSSWGRGVQVMKDAIALYGRNIFLIWLFGIWQLTNPLAFGVVFFVACSYGFTVAGFVLLYGLKGIWVSLLLIGVQAAIVLMVSMWMITSAQKKRKYEGQMPYKKYGIVLGVALMVVSMVALLDSYIQPLTIWIVRQII